MRGAAWAIGSGIVVRVFGVLGTLILTRYLAPAEYGAVSVAVTLVLTVNVFSTMGLGQYIASRPEHDRHATFHALLVHVGLGCIALFGAWVLRNRLTGWLHASEAAAFMAPLCIALGFERICYVPERVLLQRMRFREVSVARSVSGLIYTLGSVGLAAAGFGASSIVWGNVARYLCKLIMVAMYADRADWLSPCRISLATTRRLLAYGVPLSIGSFTSYVTGNWDNLLIARWFGTDALGAYNLAYNLADTPATQIAEQAGDVLVPSYAQLGEKDRRHAFVRSIAALSMVVTPIAVGLGIVAPTLVEALLDPRWQEAAPMLLVLATLSVVRPAVWISDAYLMAIDRPRLALFIETAKLIFLFGALATIGRISPLWACGAIGIGFTLTCALALFTASRTDKVSARKLFAAELAPTGPVLTMICAVLLGRALMLRLGWGAQVRLGGEVLIGGVVYVVAAFVLVPKLSRELSQGLKAALIRRTGMGSGARLEASNE